MKTMFRGIEVDCRPKGKSGTYKTNEYRAHTLIKHKESGKCFVDVLAVVGVKYNVPFGYDFHGWVLVPDEKEIERNFDLEEESIGAFLSRKMVAITDEEFNQLKVETNQ